jgi:hypothetical protein
MVSCSLGCFELAQIAPASDPPQGGLGENVQVSRVAHITELLRLGGMDSDTGLGHAVPNDMGEAWDAAKARTADAKKRLPADVCRWHDLRHTFVSRLVEGGTPYPKLAAILGWSPATAVRMAKRYGHVSVEALRKDEDRLDRRENEGEGAKKGAKWTPEPSSSVSSPHEFKWLWGVESNHQPSG